MRMKIPQVAFMPQMAMDESQLLVILCERKGWSCSKQYSKIRRFVIVDEYSPQKLMWGYWYSDTPFFRSGGRKFLALQGLIQWSRRSIGDSGISGAVRQSRRSRRSDGCPGVCGAQLAVPTIQMPRALRPVQLLNRVPSDKAFTRSFFSMQKKWREAKNEFFGFYRRNVSKTVAFGKQCEMKTQRTKIYSQNEWIWWWKSQKLTRTRWLSKDSRRW